MIKEHSDMSIKITLCNMVSILRLYIDLDVYIFAINNKITYEKNY